MFNPYSYMKDKWKKDYDSTVHFMNLLQSLLSMFNYTGLPDTLRPELLEMFCITSGSAGVTELNGGLYTGEGGFSGEPVNFINTDYIICNPGVGDRTFKIGKTGVVCWNNLTRWPDIMLMQYSSILTEIDVSERCNVLFSRLLRIPRVKDNKEKKAIEDCVKDILEGKFTAVQSYGIQDEILKGVEPPENRFIDLADVDKVDKLQYLNQYRDNIIKRWFQVYGQGMQNTAKLAQQTTDELHGNDAVSMIIPLQKLQCRKKFCEELNAMYGEKYGFHAAVDFSESYKDSLEEMRELYSTGRPESDPDPEGGNDNAATN